jgi:hypothetical protein
VTRDITTTTMMTTNNNEDDKNNNNNNTLFIWAIFRTRKNKLQANNAYKTNGESFHCTNKV